MGAILEMRQLLRSVLKPTEGLPERIIGEHVLPAINAAEALADQLMIPTNKFLVERLKEQI